MWAVGEHFDDGLIEHWNGSAWSVVASPKLRSTSDAGGSNGLVGVAVRSQTDAWVVGSQIESTLTEHWNGKKWSLVGSPDGGRDESFFAGVTTLSARDAWAVGTSDEIQFKQALRTQADVLVEHGNGRTWKVVRTPRLEGGIFDVAARTPSDVWAVGYIGSNWDAARRPLILHWNGRRWSSVRSAPVRAHSGLNSVAVFSTHEAWASGISGLSLGNEQRGFVIHWNGRNWKLIPGLSVSGRWYLLEGVVPPSGTGTWALKGKHEGRDVLLVRSRSCNG